MPINSFPAVRSLQTLACKCDFRFSFVPGQESFWRMMGVTAYTFCLQWAQTDKNDLFFFFLSLLRMFPRRHWLRVKCFNIAVMINKSYIHRDAITHASHRLSQLQGAGLSKTTCLGLLHRANSLASTHPAPHPAHDTQPSGIGGHGLDQVTQTFQVKA